MKWGVRGVADSDDSAGVKSSVGQKVVVRWRGVLGGAERAHVDYCALEDAS